MPDQPRQLRPGIDLGTTFSSIHVGDTSISLNHGQANFPSVIKIKARGPWSLAKESDEETQRISLVRLVKRIIGRTRTDGQLHKDMAMVPHSEFEDDTDESRVCIAVGGTRLRPEEVSAFILAKMKITAEAAAGNGTEYSGCVLTVPAYFTAAQRDAELTAAEIAGFSRDQVKIVDEPLAALVGHTDSWSPTDLPDGYSVVFDCGGGTTDITIVRIMERENMPGTSYIVLASAGDNCLGGMDITQRLVSLVITKAGVTRAGAPRLVESPALLEKCEELKRVLSTSDEVSEEFEVNSDDDVDVDIDSDNDDNINDCDSGINDDGTITIVITAQEFEEACKDLVPRFRDLIHQAARQLWADKKPKDDRVIILTDDGEDVITSKTKGKEAVAGKTEERKSRNHLGLLVGGTSNIPWLRSLVQSTFEGPDFQSTFGGLKFQPLNTAEIISRGAAIIGDSSRNIDTRHVTPRSLGISVIENDEVGVMKVMVKKNTPIPIQEGSEDLIALPDQSELNIEVYEGEDRLVENNILLGWCTIPLPPLEEYAEVDVGLDVQDLGVMTCRAKCAGQEDSIKIKYVQAMSVEEIQEAQRRTLQRVGKPSQPGTEIKRKGSDITKEESIKRMK